MVGGSFQITHGPGTFEDGGKIMLLNGSPDSDIDLFFSASPGDLTDDSFFNPFPFFDFESHVGTPHTFRLKDDQGSLLLQIDHAHTVGASTTTTSTTLPAGECGDPTGSGISASDALLALKAAVGSGTCATCLCDVDGSGAVAASDALIVLKIATGQQLTLACPAC